MTAESFLGILFCGGRGRRLGAITEYVSKAFVPVYDRPVFQYGLDQLTSSHLVKDILILSNDANDAALARTGWPTLVQDDALVTDMFSGLEFVRQHTADSRPAVMVPCDNLSEVRVDDVIQLFTERRAQLAFSIRRVDDPLKLRQMGVFDPNEAHMEYRPTQPRSPWGVIAPYVASSDLELSGLSETEVFNRHRLAWTEYHGPWYDVGDPDTLVAATLAMQRVARDKQQP